MRPRAVDRGADRGSLPAGRRRRRRGLRRARADAGGVWLRACRHAGVGHRGRRRCRTGARRRRPAHRARLVAIDLPRPSPGGDSAGGPDHRSGAGRSDPARRGCRRAPPPGGQRRARPDLGGARGGAVPGRPDADRGLAAEPDRGCGGGQRAPGMRVAVRPARPTSPRGRGAGGGGRDPDRGRPRGARAAPESVGGAHVPAPGAGRRRPRADPLGAHRGGPGRAARRRRSTAAGRSRRAMPASSWDCCC